MNVIIFFYAEKVLFEEIRWDFQIVCLSRLYVQKQFQRQYIVFDCKRLVSAVLMTRIVMKTEWVKASAI